MLPKIVVSVNSIPAAYQEVPKHVKMLDGPSDKKL